MFKDLTTYGLRQGIEVLVLTPGFIKRRTAWRYDADRSRWNIEDVNIPDIVIRRSGTFRSASEKTVSEDLFWLKQFGCLRTLPRKCSNKWHLYQVLSERDPLRSHLPKSYLASSPSEVFRTVQILQDAYVKPLTGTQGVSVYRLVNQAGQVVASYERRVVPRHVERLTKVFEPKTEVVAALCRSEREFREFWSKTGLRRCLVQETIQLPRTRDGNPFDLRWLVQFTDKPLVVARVARVGMSNSITTNIHTGGMAVNAEELVTEVWPDRASDILTNIDDVALSTVRRLRQRYGSFAELGIDLAHRPDGSIVIFEVNPTPGRRMLRSLPGKVRELSLKCLLEYAIKAIGDAEIDQ